MARQDAALAANPTAGNLLYYTLKSNDPNLKPGDLRFAETAEYLETALAGAGYIRTSDTAEADVAISFKTEMKGPIQQSETRTEPVFYSRPSYTRVAVVDKKGHLIGYSWTPGPSYTDIYHERSTRTYSLYQKSLTMSARELQPDGTPGEELWNLTVRATDQSQDMRAYVPVLAAAAMNYVGAETNGEQHIVLKDDSEVINFVRQGM
ncbi:MAG: hypothetical protein E1N59_3109 [Puniceicoccaceae bacterium 5H]|nr:MAG: hypothetical protein E1N59_3109 [Puniceicoccaceae bacterium 5H]